MDEPRATTFTRGGEDPAFVIEYARQRGWRISRAQLERRHRAGVVERPRQEARGRGRGSVTIYPAGTAALLVEGLEIGGTRTPLQQVAFELWLRGRRVPMPVVRHYLAGLATLHDRLAVVIRLLGFGRAVLPERALRFIERLARDRAPTAIGAMRRRLGTTERVETLMRAALEAAGGVYVPQQVVLGDADDEGWLLELALNLKMARVEAPVGAAPWLRGSASEILALSSRLYAGDWSSDLTRMTDAELNRGREGWVQLRAFFTVIRDMREIYGDDVLGLGALAEGYALATPLIDALAVLVIARDARGANLLGDHTALADVCAKWRELVSMKLDGLRALRAFPPTAALVSQERLRATLVNAEARAQWEIDTRDVGHAYRSEIATLLAPGRDVADEAGPSKQSVGRC